MTPKQQQAADNAKVMMAFAEGKEIEYKSAEGGWMPTGNPSWDFAVCQYRIKPQKLRCWVNVYKSGGMMLHRSKEDAENDISRDGSGTHTRIAVEMVEAERGQE